MGVGWVEGGWEEGWNLPQIRFPSEFAANSQQETGRAGGGAATLGGGVEEPGRQPMGVEEGVGANLHANSREFAGKERERGGRPWVAGWPPANGGGGEWGWGWVEGG